MDLWNNQNNISEQVKVDYINKSIIWIKDIIKVIVRLISISKENYNNFKKCILPLIGALAEITYSLNDLKISNLLSEKQEKSLYRDEIIYSLCAATLYARTNRNVIKIFALMFDLKVDRKFEEINFKMDY